MKFELNQYLMADAHHHLWDLSAVDYPWLQARGVKRFFGDPTPIQKDYLVQNYREDIGELNVTHSVHIQVGAADDQHFAESQSIQAMADLWPESNTANAIVAYCDLESPDVHKQLDQLAELNNLRGIRQIVGRAPEEDAATGTDSLINNPRWLDGLGELEQRGLSFDLQLIPDQMLRVAEVLRQVPNLKVALCHCGSPWYRDERGWNMWKEGLQALADNPNVYCKISGLSMFDHDWQPQTLKPIVDTVVSTFGADRVMCGSNFPVDKLHTNYLRLWQAYIALLEQHPDQISEQELAAMIRSNCLNFYKIS